MPGGAEFNKRLVDAANRLRAAQDGYLKAIHEHVEAERMYKLGDSVAMTSIDEYKNADDRRAQAEVLLIEIAPDATAPRQRVTLNALRYAAHLAEGQRDAAKQAVQNYRQEMSSLQSLMSLEKTEMDFEKYKVREDSA